MDPLVRQTEKLRGVACAHLEASAAEHANGTARCCGGTPIFLLGVPTEKSVRAVTIDVTAMYE